MLLPWLAVGWRQNPPFARAGEIYSADLRHIYPHSEAGHLYARSAPVAALEETLKRRGICCSHSNSSGSRSMLSHIMSAATTAYAYTRFGLRRHLLP